ncbi:MAG: head-tail connector protein [Polaromonas sp.]|nr:head-tail connector protein [Polaromonas sp.]
MALVDLPAAKAHLRLGAGYPDEQVAPYLSAAELLAIKFLNRGVFADDTALSAAIAAVPAALIAAGTAYGAAMTAADAITDPVAREADRAYAADVYREAQTAARQTRAGIVVNDLIKAGILLILGHLFENREDVVTAVTVAPLPMGSRHLLTPFRVDMGY